MGDVTRVLSGLEDSEVTGVVKAPGGGLEVSVRLACLDAACPRCGTFSSRVKEYRSQTELTGHRGRRATAQRAWRPTPNVPGAPTSMHTVTPADAVHGALLLAEHPSPRSDPAPRGTPRKGLRFAAEARIRCISRNIEVRNVGGRNFGFAACVVSFARGILPSADDAEARLLRRICAAAVTRLA